MILRADAGVASSVSLLSFASAQSTVTRVTWSTRPPSRLRLWRKRTPPRTELRLSTGWSRLKQEALANQLCPSVWLTGHGSGWLSRAEPEPESERSEQSEQADESSGVEEESEVEKV